MDELYQRLAEHLDRLPDGFAPSEIGAEIHLLKRLFTPEEAELAVHLTLDREEAGAIAARAHLPEEEASYSRRSLRERFSTRLLLSSSASTSSR
jgi:electron transport complex protein RnfB